MRLNWDETENRLFTQGISNGVLYPDDSPGVAWNGLISVTEDGEAGIDSKYFDGLRYINRPLKTDFSGIISAYTYPDEFEPYVGVSAAVTAQPRRPFGFCYRTNREIHLVYNALAAPSKRPYSTSGADVQLLAFEWNFTTQPVKIPGGRSSAHLVILIDQSPEGSVSDLEAIIYGDDNNDPFLPMPEDVTEIFESHTSLRVWDYGNGLCGFDAPPEIIPPFVGDIMEITCSSVIQIDGYIYEISSL